MASRVQYQTVRSAIVKPVMNDQWDDRIGTILSRAKFEA
jgi:hypothetical protein